eukprot:scaffold5310_cov378-Prasinococcus_capsulatus_cf.AAC.9
MPSTRALRRSMRDCAGAGALGPTPVVKVHVPHRTIATLANIQTPGGAHGHRRTRWPSWRSFVDELYHSSWHMAATTRPVGNACGRAATRGLRSPGPAMRVALK